MKSIKISLKLLTLTVFLGFLCFVPTVAKAATNDSFQINIDRVFMHLPNDYSVAYTDSDSKVVTIERLSEYQFPSSRKTILNWTWEHNKSWTHSEVQQIIIADVSRGEPMYVKVTGNGDRGIFTISIHIHSAEEISGGQWSSGVGSRERHQDTSVVQ